MNVKKIPPRRGPLVEDTQVSGGQDASGAPAIVTRGVDGHAPGSITPTDSRESSDSSHAGDSGSCDAGGCDAGGCD